MEKEIWRGLAIGLIAGAVVGAGLGILYAPQSGRKTRKDIRDKAEDISDTVKGKADEIVDNAEKYRRKVMSAVKEFT